MKKVISFALLILVFTSCGGGESTSESALPESNDNSDFLKSPPPLLSIKDSVQVKTIIYDLLTEMAHPGQKIDLDLKIEGLYLEPEQADGLYYRIIHAIWLNQKSKTALYQGLFGEHKTGNNIIKFILEELKDY